MAFGLAVDNHKIGLDSAIGRLHYRAVTGSIVGLYAFREVDRIPSSSHHESLLVLSAGNVLQVGCLVMPVVAVPMRDLMAGRTVAQKCSRDQAVNRAFPLEPVAGQADLETPIFYLDGLQDLAGLSIADLSLVRDLINAIVSGDVAPLFGHTHCSLAGHPEKGIPRRLSLGITDLQVQDYKG